MTNSTANNRKSLSTTIDRNKITQGISTTPAAATNYENMWWQKKTKADQTEEAIDAANRTS